MRRVIARASALFVLGIFAGSFVSTPPVAVDTESQALAQVQSAYPYLQAVSENQIPTPEANKVLVSEADINARFTGMLLHLKWLISGEADNEGNEITRLNKQIYSFMDDVGDDFSDLRRDIDDDTGSNLTAGPSGYVLISNGTDTEWVATSSLGLTASATPLTDDDVIPDYLASVGQIDEYCLTYEMTGDTWEWQTCGSSGSGFATTSINTSLKLANIVTDETGSGSLVFSNSPIFTGTTTNESANFSGDVVIGGNTSSAKLSIDNTTSTFGGELVSNGTFTGSAAGWTLGDCVSYGANNVTITYTACSDTTIATDFVTTAGDTYQLSFTVSAVTNEQAYLYLYQNAEGIEYGPFGAGTHTISFLTDYSGTETIVFDIWNYASGGSITLDDISIRQTTSSKPSFAITGYDGSSEILLSKNAANVAFGLNALGGLTTGVQNVAVGRSAGSAGTLFEKNTFVGYRAGEIATGSENVFVGSGSGAYNTGDNSVFIGNEAGTFSADSDSSTVVGSGAGYYSTGDYNSYFGSIAGFGSLGVSTGNFNSFFGWSAGRANTSGYSNIFVGANAGYSNTSGIGNVLVGTDAGFSNTVYGGNVLLGQSAGYFLQSSNNIMIGSSAGDNVTSGGSNIVIGYNIDAPSATASYQLNIGNLIFGNSINGLGTTLSTGSIGIGTTSPNAKLTVHGDINVSQGSGVIQFGGTRYLYASTTNDSITFGEFAGTSFTSGTIYNIAFGYEAGRNMSNTNADYMTMLGYQAGYQNSGDHTNIVGFGAGYQNSGDYTSIMGPSAGLANTGDYNNLIGAFAGRNNTGGFNNFIGHSAGFQNTGNYNNAIGYYAGYNNTGSNSDIIGYQAGRYLLASSSVVIGAEALYGSHATNFIAPNNIAIGYRAGYTADDGASNNILIGYQAADNITTGNNNIIIGYDIDAVSPTADNRLNIGNLVFGTGLDGTGTTLSSGNIGIGTTTPTRKLEIFGTTAGSAVVRIDEPRPRYEWRESDATTNNRLWRIEAEGGVWSLSAQNDALNQINSAFSIRRSAATPTSFEISDLRFSVNDNDPDFRAEIVGTSGSGYFALSSDASSDGNIFKVDTTGNVGLGTTTPAQKLQVFGNIRVGTTGSNGCLEDYGGGLIAGTCSSDEDLKENIEPIAQEGRSYLESLAALTPVTYNWNEKATELYSKSGSVENLGLIAQDVEAEFPELVSLNDEGYRQIDFRAFPFYIIEALKEVWEKLQGYDERIDELEEENEYLKSRLDAIEDEFDVPSPVPPPSSSEEPVISETEQTQEEMPIDEVSTESEEPEPDEDVTLVSGESE